MKEELGKLTEQVVRGGQAVISGIKSETDKLIDEAVKLMDDKKKKTWSGYDTICLAQAPEGIVPGCAGGRLLPGLLYLRRTGCADGKRHQSANHHRHLGGRAERL